jgi:U4/U6.U5 tri-snRNP-associated protein 2
MYSGIVGINNPKNADYLTSTLQSLLRVRLIRNFFFFNEKMDHEVAQKFGELVRKFYNPQNFKSHVSPHEFLQV